MSMQSKCAAILGSVTAATAAQRILARAAVYSEVVRISGSNDGKGCVYGVEFPCALTQNVRTVLSSARVRVRGYTSSEGGGTR